MSPLRTNSTTKDILLSREWDPCVWSHRGIAWQILCQRSLTWQQLPGTLISTN